MLLPGISLTLRLLPRPPPARLGNLVPNVLRKNGRFIDRNILLVGGSGGFNPSEKHESNSQIGSFPQVAGENKTYLKLKPLQYLDWALPKHW